jgi:hypothetical protein
MSIRKIFATTALILLGALGATAARAGDVHWSVGINLPPVGTVISNAPVYHPAPVVYAPPPVVYAPAPVVVHPAPRVIYAPPPAVVYRPAPPVVYAPYGPYGHRHYHRHSHHRDRWDDRRVDDDRWRRGDGRYDYRR